MRGTARDLGGAYADEGAWPLGCGLPKGAGLMSTGPDRAVRGVARAERSLSHAPADRLRAQGAGPKPGGAAIAKGREQCQGRVSWAGPHRRCRGGDAAPEPSGHGGAPQCCGACVGGAGPPRPTLKDSKKPGAAPPLSGRSSSGPSPSMAWLRACSSSCRVSSSAARVRSCASAPPCCAHTRHPPRNTQPPPNAGPAPTLLHPRGDAHNTPQPCTAPCHAPPAHPTQHGTSPRNALPSLLPPHLRPPHDSPDPGTTHLPSPCPPTRSPRAVRGSHSPARPQPCVVPQGLPSPSGCPRAPGAHPAPAVPSPLAWRTSQRGSRRTRR